jgi:hypothetical protein
MYIEDPKSVDLRSEKNKEKVWQQNSRQAQVPATFQKLYVVLYRACSLYVLIDSVLCRAVR